MKAQNSENIMRMRVMPVVLPVVLSGIMFAAFMLFASGCLQSKPQLVEKTPEADSQREEILVKVDTDNGAKNAPEAQGDAVQKTADGADTGKNEKKDSPSLLMDEEGIPLDMHFADITGRSNPFIPPGASFGGPTSPATSSPSQPLVMPKASSAVPTLPNDPQKGQLMPIEGQTTTSAAIPPIPEWPGESPVLSAGPPEKLQSLLDLRYRGLMVSRKGKKVGVIEATMKIGEVDRIMSFVITPGKYVTEYNLKVKEMDAQHVVLVRGSQRIELPLVEQGKNYEYAESKGMQQSPYASKVGSDKMFHGEGAETGSSGTGQ